MILHVFDDEFAEIRIIRVFARLDERLADDAKSHGDCFMGRKWVPVGTFEFHKVNKLTLPGFAHRTFRYMPYLQEYGSF